MELESENIIHHRWCFTWGSCHDHLQRWIVPVLILLLFSFCSVLVVVVEVDSAAAAVPFRPRLAHSRGLFLPLVLLLLQPLCSSSLAVVVCFLELDRPLRRVWLLVLDRLLLTAPSVLLLVPCQEAAANRLQPSSMITSPCNSSSSRELVFRTSKCFLSAFR